MKKHTEKTLNSYNKKQLIYYIQKLEEEKIQDFEQKKELEKVINDFIIKHRNDLNITIKFEDEGGKE